MRHLFLTAVLGLGFFFLFSLALAQEAAPVTPSASPSPITYSLPYPGILPDHPLYFAKMVRDQILLLLITNPVRRVEFHILLADKHLNMGMFLMEKGDAPRAVETIAQGVKYLKKAEEHLFQIPGGGTPEVMSLKDRYEKSLLKHQELISSLKLQLIGGAPTEIDHVAQDVDRLLEDFAKNK